MQATLKAEKHPQIHLLEHSQIRRDERSPYGEFWCPLDGQATGSFGREATVEVACTARFR